MDILFAFKEWVLGIYKEKIRVLNKNFLGTFHLKNSKDGVSILKPNDRERENEIIKK